MTISIILNKLTVLIPSVVIAILSYDLIRNQSLITQYIHWISFVSVGVLTASVTGLTIGSCLKESNSSQASQKETTKADDGEIDQNVQRLSKVIVEHYIQFWADPLHGGKSDLSDELAEAIHSLLLSLCLKLEKVDRPTLALHFLTLLRLHLSKPILKEEPITESQQKLRCKQVEFGVHKLLESLDKKWLTSDLLFTTVTKLISNLVVWKLLQNLSEPKTWQQPFISDFNHECPQNHSAIKPEMVTRKMEQPPQVLHQQKRPIEPFIKVTDEEIPATNEDKNENRESLRLSFQSSSRISTALGNIFSGSAGPLLPGNIAFQSFNKMWRSPSSETLEFPRDTCFTVDTIDLPKKAQTRKNSLKSACKAFMPKMRKLSHHEPLTRPNFLEPPSQSAAGSRESSDEESLNYEDNTDLESTIMKLRQLLVDKSGEDSITSSTSDDVQMSPSSQLCAAASKTDQQFLNFDVIKESGDTFKIQFQQQPSMPNDESVTGSKSFFSIKKKSTECLELDEKLGFKGEPLVLMVEDSNSAKCLQDWLSALAKDPIIGQSEDLKDFLCPTKNKVNNKGLAKKMTGMLNSLKDAFPTFDDEQLQQATDQNCHGAAGLRGSDGGGGDNPSHKEETKSFLLPNIFPSTPLSSPKDPSPASARRRSSLSTQMQQRQKVTFSFKHSSNEKSELEATLDFHIQHWNYNSYGSGNDNESAAAANETSEEDVEKHDNEHSLTLLTSSFLTFLLVDAPDMLLFQDGNEENWLNNEILHQILKARTEKMISDFFHTIDDQYSTSHLIQIIIGLIEGSTLPVMAGSQHFFLDEIAKSPYLQSLLRLFGTSKERLVETLVRLTSNRQENVDFWISVFHMLVNELIRLK